MARSKLLTRERWVNRLPAWERAGLTLATLSGVLTVSAAIYMHVGSAKPTLPAAPESTSDHHKAEVTAGLAALTLLGLGIRGTSAIARQRLAISTQQAAIDSINSLDFDPLVERLIIEHSDQPLEPPAPTDY